MTIFHVLKLAPVEDLLWKDLPPSVKTGFEKWMDSRGRANFASIDVATAKLTELLLEYDGDEI